MLRKIRLFFVVAAVAAPVSWSLPNADAAEAGPGQGLVIFHRKDVLNGRAIRFNIEQDGVPIGQLLAGTTIERALEPGNYAFTVRAPSLDGQDFLSIAVEAGRTYEVEGVILWGWPTGRPKFELGSSSGTLTSPVPVKASAPTGALANAALGSAVASSPTRPDAVEVGRLGLRNFTGDWNFDMWSLTDAGDKLEGSGSATGTAEGANGTRIMINEFRSAAFPAATGGGHVLLSHDPRRGYILVSNFTHTDEVLRFSGQYQADTGKYVFFMFGGSGSSFATGVARSSVRVEVHSQDASRWIAETYSSVDGRMTKVQSYQFTRP
jgi:hypothetical protein